jgi:protein SCO1/2
VKLSKILCHTIGEKMLSRTNPKLNNQLIKSAKAWRNVVGAITIGMFTFSVSAISEVKAEEQSGHSMHDMHDMQGMQGMQGMHDMDHMDHSMHQQQLSQRGTYTSAVMTYAVPDVKLIDSNGKTVALRELVNERSSTILNFIFTTCTTICPVMSATFQQIQEQLGPDRKDVHLISISIDPENDTPAKLKAYSEKFKTGSQWTLLTGSLENSLAAQKAFGIFAGEKMNHKPVTFLKTKGSETQWVRIDGLAEASQIIKEFEKLSPDQKLH